jgi:hypothetical protein
MIKTILFLVLTALLISACHKGHGSLTVNLKDGPAGLDEINVDLESIEVCVEDKWYKLKTNKGIYNILQFQNSSALVATENEIPEGKISFVKLVLGSNNSILEDGNYKPLMTRCSPGEKFMVVIPADCTISPNQASNILLDIDAERSISKTPTGKFYLHPVATSGVISSPMEIY